jgi:hypothetical protein
MRGLIVGTGPSLRPMLPLLRRFKGLVFTCNNTFEDVRTDVWLACDPAWNQYECNEVILIGHDFHYPEGQPRHYFNDLSETPGEYPAKLRKFSLFDKQGKGDDLLAVYKRIAVQEGRPEIINCTPGSALKHFPMGNLADYLH